MPTFQPSLAPTASPSLSPSLAPTAAPTLSPSSSPSLPPSPSPTAAPTLLPSSSPSMAPTALPSLGPSSEPSPQPTALPLPPPSPLPTLVPSPVPSRSPSSLPTFLPTLEPSGEPTPMPSPGPCRPGTYADVHWVKDGLFDASEAYAATVDTDQALATKVRFQGGGGGRAPPRFNCTACPLGRFSNRSGIYYDGCLPCPNGTFSDDPDGVTQCTACPRGHFQVVHGSSSCDECPAGRFMNFTGEGTECEECQRGRSTNGETGLFSCPDCFELNTPQKKGFTPLTECELEEGMSCGKPGGQYYFQSNKGREFCRECKNSGNKGAYGCHHKSGEIQCKFATIYACSLLLFGLLDAFCHSSWHSNVCSS